MATEAIRVRAGPPRFPAAKGSLAESAATPSIQCDDLVDTTRPYTDEVAVFADWWLPEWVKHGGSVTRLVDGSHLIGWAEYPFGPVYADAASGAAAWIDKLPAASRAAELERHHAYYRARFDGTMRALLASLDALPGGLAAVKALVAAEPARGVSWLCGESAA